MWKSLLKFRRPRRPEEDLILPERNPVTTNVEAGFFDILIPILLGWGLFRETILPLVKGYCSEDSNGLLQQAIEGNAGATLGTMKSLRIALQEDQRCVGMKALLEQ